MSVVTWSVTVMTFMIMAHQKKSQDQGNFEKSEHLLTLVSPKKEVNIVT